MNNDINYAEIITVFSQKEDYAYYQMSYSEFYDAIAGKERAGMFFEMTLDEEPTFFYWNDKEHTSFTVCVDADEAKAKAKEKNPDVNYDEEESKEGEETSEETSEEETEENVDEDGVVKDGNYGWGYFYDVTIYPYGLDEIYSAAGVNPDAENYIQPEFKNKKVLDYQEGFLRSYLGKETYLGPSYSKERVLQKGTVNLTSTWKQLYDALGYESLGRTANNWCINSVTTMEIGIGDVVYDTPSVIVDYHPNGSSVILAVSNKIYQGDSRWGSCPRGNGNHTIREAACIDCCYIMAAEYFNHKSYNIVQVCSDGPGGYVHGQSFYYGDFCTDNGIDFRNISPTTSAIISELARGNVCEMCIGGGYYKDDEGNSHGIKKPWYTEDGMCLHNTAEHHLLIVGYDDDGFYFVDPGSSYVTTTKLSFKTFSNAPVRYINSLYPTNGQLPTYKFNNILE